MKQELVLQHLTSPPATWDKTVTSLSDNEKADLFSELDAMAQRSAMLAAYIALRINTDNGHDAAVKAANKKLAQVRKALGYTYPESGCFNF